MKHVTETLDQLRVAKPCAVAWDAMSGDERTRFCSSCDKHVHDLSLMTRAEVAGLVSRTGGRFCGKLSRLPDGTLITSDLFTARPQTRGRAARMAGAALTALLGLCANAFAQMPTQSEGVNAGRPPYVLKHDDKPETRAAGVTALRGTIFDITDAVIVGAEIKLREINTKREYQAATDDGGVYVFPSVDAGIYTFEASANGFTTFLKSDLRLPKGERMTLDVTLQVGATMGDIIVTPPPEIGAAEGVTTRISNVLMPSRRRAKKKP